jgi:hypothetical protein
MKIAAMIVMMAAATSSSNNGLIEFDPIRYPWRNPSQSQAQKQQRSNSAILDVFYIDYKVGHYDSALSAGWRAELTTTAGNCTFDLKDVVVQAWNESVAIVTNQSGFVFTESPQVALHNETMALLHHHSLLILQTLTQMTSLTLPYRTSNTLLANDAGVFVASWDVSPATVDIVMFRTGFVNTSLGSFPCDDNPEGPTIIAAANYLLLYSQSSGMTLIHTPSGLATPVSETSARDGIGFRLWQRPFLTTTALAYPLDRQSNITLRYQPIHPATMAAPTVDYANSYDLDTGLSTLEAPCFCSGNPALTAMAITLTFSSNGVPTGYQFGVRVLNNTAWPVGRSMTDVHYADWLIPLQVTGESKLAQVGIQCDESNLLVDYASLSSQQLFRFTRPLAELTALMKPYTYAPTAISSQTTSMPSSTTPASSLSSLSTPAASSESTPSTTSSTTSLSTPVMTSTSTTGRSPPTSTTGSTPTATPAKHGTQQDQLIIVVSVIMALVCLVVIFAIARLLTRRQRAARAYYILALDELEGSHEADRDDDVSTLSIRLKPIACSGMLTLL